MTIWNSSEVKNFFKVVKVSMWIMNQNLLWRRIEYNWIGYKREKLKQIKMLKRVEIS